MSKAKSGSPNALVRRWKWVCELCFRTTPSTNLPKKWLLVWQSAICPVCAEIAKTSGIGFVSLKGGIWAGRRKDPRALSPNAERSATGAERKETQP